MTFEQTVAARHSVRNFDNTQLSAQQRAELLYTAQQCATPFGATASFAWATVDAGTDFRPSTYGFITGARDYLLVGAPDTPAARMAAGYAGEQALLRAVAMGLGTCWIAGTFNKSTFTAAAGFAPGTDLIAVIPVGVARARGSILNSISRLVAGSSHRKDMDALFYEEATRGIDRAPRQPLSIDSRFYRPLESVRLAPSSTNSQPWRAIVSTDDRHITIYNVGHKTMQEIDLGIAVSHFTGACRELGLDITPAPFPPTSPQAWTPVISFTIN